MDKKRLYVCEVVTLGVRHSIKQIFTELVMLVNALRFVAVAVHLFRFKDYRQLSTAIESNIFQTKIIGQLN